MMIDGILFRFIDTAGLRSTSDEIEKIGISRSYRKISEASVVLCLLDVTASDDENEASISDIVSKLDLSRQELIVLLNKADLIGPNINVKILNNTVSSLDEKVVKLYISAKNGDGLDDLKKVLVKTQKDLSLESDQTVVTNIRHYNALKEAGKALLAVKENLSSGAGSELLSEDLRMAISQLGNITGEITTDEILGNIFSRFCIGK
jgi:tRNA modification GTPase